MRFRTGLVSIFIILGEKSHFFNDQKLFGIENKRIQRYTDFPMLECWYEEYGMVSLSLFFFRYFFLCGGVSLVEPLRWWCCLLQVCKTHVSLIAYFCCFMNACVHVLVLFV